MSAPQRVLFLWRQLLNKSLRRSYLLCTPNARGDLGYQTTSGRSTSCTHAIASALFRSPVCKGQWLVACNSLCNRVDHFCGRASYIAPVLIATLVRSNLAWPTVWKEVLWRSLRGTGPRYDVPTESPSLKDFVLVETRRQHARLAKVLTRNKACVARLILQWLSCAHAKKGTLGFPVFWFVGVVVFRREGGAGVRN